MEITPLMLHDVGMQSYGLLLKPQQAGNCSEVYGFGSSVGVLKMGASYECLFDEWLQSMYKIFMFPCYNYFLTQN